MTLLRLRDACQRARVGAATRRQGADADLRSASMGRSSRKQGDERPVRPFLIPPQIDLLYQQALVQFAQIAQVHRAIAEEDFERVERLDREFDEDRRLLEVLASEREECEAGLRFASPEVRRSLERLRNNAASEAGNPIEPIRESARLTAGICGRLLEQQAWR